MIYGIEPIFEFENRIKCRMQIENITYEEEEETKEKAKLKVLKKFWAFTKKEETRKSDTNIIKVNFVGKLQNTCLKFKRLGFPNYEDTVGYGPMNRRKFEVTCRVGETTTSGTSSTKKSAKQKAAKKMMQFLETKNDLR